MAERTVTHPTYPFETNKLTRRDLFKFGGAVLTTSLLEGSLNKNAEAAEVTVYPNFYLIMVPNTNKGMVKLSERATLWVTAEEKVLKKEQIPPELLSRVIGRINGTADYVVNLNGFKWTKGSSPELVKDFAAKSNAERNNCPAVWLTFRNELGIDEDGELVLTDEPVKDTFISSEVCCPSTFTFKEQPFTIIPKPPKQVVPPPQPTPTPTPTPSPTVPPPPPATPVPAPPQVPKAGGWCPEGTDPRPTQDENGNPFIACD